MVDFGLFMHLFLLCQQLTWIVHVVRLWKSSSKDSISCYGNQVQRTRFPVWFHHNIMARGCKSTRLETISTKGNRLYWTRFSINGHHPSTCRMWVPTRTFFSPYLSHSVSSAPTTFFTQSQLSLALTPSHTTLYHR